MRRSKDFLDKNLQHIGRHLQQTALSAHAVRADTALERGTHLALHVNHDYSQHRIEQDDNHTHNDAFNREGHPLWHHPTQSGMYDGSERLQVIIIVHVIQ